MSRRRTGKKPRVKPGARPVEESVGLREAFPPGECLLVNVLHPSDPVYRYMVDRGFDVHELARTWRVSYCIADKCLVAGRLIIPIVMDGVYVGWQARYLLEPKPNFPKYYTMPGLPKQLVVYNIDLARQQPLVVICAGVTDVWRVGPCGVALLGNQASPQQLNLLGASWQGKPAVVLLDGNACEDATKLVSELKPYFPAGVVQVTLPPEASPCSMNRVSLWTMIREQAAQQGVPLPATDSVATAITIPGA